MFTFIKNLYTIKWIRNNKRKQVERGNKINENIDANMGISTKNSWRNR